MSIVYYTDGSAKKNGSKDATGGWAFICVENDKIIKQRQEPFYTGDVTNNRMELEAILNAIHDIHENNYDNDFCVPTIYSDSQYCVSVINDWMEQWCKKGWRKLSNGAIPENLDIISAIYELKHKGYKFNLQKIKGHAGHKWNEYVDKLATGEILLSKESQ